MSSCPEQNFNELRSRFERLNKQLVDVRAKADKHKVRTWAVHKVFEVGGSEGARRRA